MEINEKNQDQFQVKDDEYLQEFRKRTGFDTAEEFYENENRIVEIETANTTTFMLNAYEISAIGFGIQQIANIYHRYKKMIVPFIGMPTHKLYIGAETLAHKIGLKLINIYDDPDYKKWSETAGEFDVYPLQWINDNYHSGDEKFLGEIDAQCNHLSGEAMLSLQSKENQDIIIDIMDTKV